MHARVFDVIPCVGCPAMYISRARICSICACIYSQGRMPSDFLKYSPARKIKLEREKEREECVHNGALPIFDGCSLRWD